MAKEIVWRYLLRRLDGEEVGAEQLERIGVAFVKACTREKIGVSGGEYHAVLEADSACELFYKGFRGSVRYRAEDRVLHGKVLEIAELASYEATDVAALERHFRAAVEDYLKRKMGGK